MTTRWWRSVIFTIIIYEKQTSFGWMLTYYDNEGSLPDRGANPPHAAWGGAKPRPSHHHPSVSTPRKYNCVHIALRMRSVRVYILAFAYYSAIIKYINPSSPPICSSRARGLPAHAVLRTFYSLIYSFQFTIFFFHDSVQPGEVVNWNSSARPRKWCEVSARKRGAVGLYMQVGSVIRERGNFVYIMRMMLGARARDI
jgi:hypothetical protein